MRWQRNSSSCMGPPPSSKVLCQRWPDELRQRQGEALPQGDHALIARIGWAQIRHLAVVEKKIFVVQGPGFEPPMSFEVERAGASLAAAVVEDAHATLRGAAHHFPIHEVITLEITRQGG